MIVSLLILGVGVVVLTPLALWYRQRAREAEAEAQRVLARLRRRHLALTTRMDEIARDVERIAPPTPPPAS